MNIKGKYSAKDAIAEIFLYMAVDLELERVLCRLRSTLYDPTKSSLS